MDKKRFKWKKWIKIDINGKNGQFNWICDGLNCKKIGCNVKTSKRGQTHPFRALAIATIFAPP